MGYSEGDMPWLQQGQEPIWSGWVTPGQGRALLAGSQAACRGTGVPGVSPHPLTRGAGLGSVLHGTTAGWAWGIPGACLRQLVSHYEMIQNREIGAKEFKWEGEF